MEELTFAQEYQLHHDALVALIGRIAPPDYPGPRELSRALDGLAAARLSTLDYAQQPEPVVQQGLSAFDGFSLDDEIPF